MSDSWGGSASFFDGLAVPAPQGSLSGTCGDAVPLALCLPENWTLERGLWRSYPLPFPSQIATFLALTGLPFLSCSSFWDFALSLQKSAGHLSKRAASQTVSSSMKGAVPTLVHGTPDSDMWPLSESSGRDSTQTRGTSKHNAPSPPLPLLS